jgi:hypothetical protein
VFRLTTFAVAALLLASPDGTRDYHLRPEAGGKPPASTDLGAPLGDIFISIFQRNQGLGSKAALRPESRLQIVRYVSGEFVRVVKPLPSDKKGFRVQAGKPIDQKELQQVLANHGSAANPGDTVQITLIEFLDKEIVVQINGGARRHRRWRDHVQIGIGGGGRSVPPVTTAASAPGTQRALGATLILDYGRPVPDMSPDDLKRDLSGFLDFNKERSAAVQWVDTLPPEYRQAIKDRRPAVGMDHDMVIAAIGRPDQKVRERDEKGEETEDWIYGTPPAKTVFVTFSGDKVIRVKQYP